MASAMPPPSPNASDSSVEVENEQVFKVSRQDKSLSHILTKLKHDYEKVQSDNAIRNSGMMIKRIRQTSLEVKR